MNFLRNIVKNILLLAVSCFFLLFGIQVLRAAYTLKDPFTFTMTFFASNLIILISAALGAGFAYRLYRTWRL